MEMPKQLSPITLPQIYQRISELLSPEIAQYIFNLHPGTDILNENLPLKRKEGGGHYLILSLTICINIALNYCGHCYTVELLKRRLLHENMSICDIRNAFSNITALHSNASNGYTKDARIFLEVAGNEVWALLSAQSTYNQTALHFAAQKGHIDFVTLLLDTAGNHVQDFVHMLDKDGKTAFDIATPEVKEVMLHYLK